ncbi:hypothetical protein GRF59_23280 [Paenibacillus sp. HJL G12]|uniref:Molecular chaperone TorD family protein n=1 Tax=Paenibacillus dendrobii TaxID=2691084 RepID=A0A7X3IM65_9BACL|nr:molecular chaperone TorD family protein [Paenibacillus dendrobii]MWV46533.1 hypothetical protein [Paenibacillus dendrobii]
MTTMAVETLLDTVEGTRWLQGRGWVYQLLIDFLEDPPSLSQMASWQRQAAMREELGLTVGGRRLQEYLSKLEPCELPQVCEEETREYKRLFACSDAVLPCVCESMYRATDQRSGQRCLQQIREAYAGCGIVFNKLQSEKDDHLTIELEFIAVAGEHMDDTQGMPECQLMWLDTQIDFLEHHLMQWTPEFSEELTALAQTLLYREIGHVLGEFIPYDVQMLRLLRKELA